MAKKRSKVVLDVLWSGDGTTQHDTYRASHASITTFRGGRCHIHLRDGSDREGPVDAAIYERYMRIVRRPKRGKR